ncbi:hypothetical protein EDP1_1450 [Pseudomonas putida S610]|nr:hypothetical protein EDP1_1450 [Pseudomonas putida S610]
MAIPLTPVLARRQGGPFLEPAEARAVMQKLMMGGGNVQDDWPELEQEQRNDKVDDPDTDPGLTDDDQDRPGVPASDPEAGA